MLFCIFDVYYISYIIIIFYDSDTMTNIAKLEFTVFHINDSNYLPWVLDDEMHLETMNLADTIKGGNATINKKKQKS